MKRKIFLTALLLISNLLLFSQNKDKNTDIKIEKGEQINILKDPSGTVNINNYTQKDYTLVGRITNKRIPISNLLIQLIGDSGHIDSTYTINDGQFVFQNLHGGEYLLLILDFSKDTLENKESDNIPSQAKLPIHLDGGEQIKNFPIDLSNLIKIKYVFSQFSHSAAFFDERRIFASHNGLNCVGENSQVIIIDENGIYELKFYTLKGVHKYHLYKIAEDTSSTCEDYYFEKLTDSFEKKIFNSEVIYCKSAAVTSAFTELTFENSEPYLEFKIKLNTTGLKDEKIFPTLYVKDSNSEFTNMKYEKKFLLSKNIEIIEFSYLLSHEIIRDQKLSYLDLIIYNEDKVPIERLDNMVVYNDKINGINAPIPFNKEDDMQLTKAFVSVENYKDAEISIKKMIDELPNDTVVNFLFNTGIYFQGRKQYDQSIFMLKKVHEIDSINPYVHYTLAFSLFQIEDYEGAIQFQKKCTDNITGMLNIIEIENIYGNLLKYLLFAKRLDEAKKLARENLFMNLSSIEQKLNLGHFFLLSGKEEDAWRIYNENLYEKIDSEFCYKYILDDLELLKKLNISKN